MCKDAWFRAKRCAYFPVVGTKANERSKPSARLRDSWSWSNCHLENACRLYAQISRDDDTARRYTSRRRVANFPRRGFSIIPLARRPALRWERVAGGGGCVGGGGGCEDGDDGGECVLSRSLFRSFSLARSRQAYRDSVWVHLVLSGRYGNLDHPLLPSWHPPSRFSATRSSQTLTLRLYPSLSLACAFSRSFGIPSSSTPFLSFEHARALFFLYPSLPG